MLRSNNILVLSPHTDDGELGCGGTISKYIQHGANVHYIAFSTCRQTLASHLPEDSLISECKVATNALGIPENNLHIYDYEVRRFSESRQEILELLINISKLLKPEIVFLPAKGDVHQDHQVIYQEGSRAFKFCNILGYELPWNNKSFQPNYFSRLTHTDVKKKAEALSHYLSQKHRNYMQEEFVQSLAKVRGVQSNTDFAEAFECYHFAE